MSTPTIKGFKHLRPGVEVAVCIRERFKRDPHHTLRTIAEVDFIGDVIRLNGTAREFGLDGIERGHTGGEPRQRLLVPIPDDVRREIWRTDARERFAAIIRDWPKADDGLIKTILVAIDEYRRAATEDDHA
jgi:hypothetical protein